MLFSQLGPSILLLHLEHTRQSCETFALSYPAHGAGGIQLPAWPPQLCVFLATVSFWFQHGAHSSEVPVFRRMYQNLPLQEVTQPSQTPGGLRALVSCPPLTGWGGGWKRPPLPRRAAHLFETQRARPPFKEFCFGGSRIPICGLFWAPEPTTA